MDTGAAPDALLAYEATCAAMEEELLRAGSVMAEAVRQWSRVSEHCGAVAMPEVAEFAREALAHDHRVGRVARRFCDADASYGFDSWTAEEVRSEAEQLAAQARTAGLDGGPWLGGFIDRAGWSRSSCTGTYCGRGRTSLTRSWSEVGAARTNRELFV